jgi:hypothetical protein
MAIRYGIPDLVSRSRRARSVIRECSEGDAMSNTIRLWNPKAEQWEDFTPVETPIALEHEGPIVTKTPVGMFVTQSTNIVGAVSMPESATERAANAVHGAVADFIVAITEAQTLAEAWRIHAMLVPLTSILESTERKALNKVEALQS